MGSSRYNFGGIISIEIGECSFHSHVFHVCTKKMFLIRFIVFNTHHTSRHVCTYMYTRVLHVLDITLYIIYLFTSIHTLLSGRGTAHCTHDFRTRPACPPALETNQHQAGTFCTAYFFVVHVKPRSANDARPNRHCCSNTFG